MTSPDGYDSIISHLRGALPEIAAEIEQEVRRGRTLNKDDLVREVRYDERVSKLAGQRLPMIGDSDIGVVPYSEDERLDMIREALGTLAETMASTRRSLLNLCHQNDIRPYVRFGDPELEEPTTIELAQETIAAEQAKEAVQEMLNIEPTE